MKALRWLALPLALCFAATPLAAQSSKTDPKLESLKERSSYAIGLNIGNSFKRQALEVDTALLLRGVQDALGDKKALMTDEEIQATLLALRQEVQMRQAKESEAASKMNLEAGKAFLAKNKKEKGVTETKSGLQYKVLTKGTGDKPGPEDRVTTHYRGTLLDGTEFDSSYGRGQPATFPVNGVIRGWTEALQLMPVGSKWQLFIPADLAYGTAGNGPIGPNSTLIFEVELIGIEK